jgi:hypothetical protein
VIEAYERTTRECLDPGCSQPTREGKPYCPEHVENMPEAAEVIAELARRKEEISNVNGEDGLAHVRLNGSIVSDLLGQLRAHGDRTLKRLMRDCKLPENAALNYAQALKGAGLVTTFWTRRGELCLRLTPRKRRRG